jgi:hypothetical protein
MSISAVIQSQLVATLLDALASVQPAAGTGPGGARAQVLSTPENGLVTVNLAGQRTDLLLSGPALKNAEIQTGAILNLRIDARGTGGAPTRATLISVTPSDAAQVFGKLVDQASGRFPDGGVVQSGQAQASSPRAIAGPIVAPLVLTQGGLAPLYANLAAALGAGDDAWPEPVRIALQRLLDLRLPVQVRGPTASELRGGITQSGLGHEARLATGNGAVAALDLKSALLTLKAALAPLIAEPLLLSETGEAAPPASSSKADTARNPGPDISPGRLPAPRRDAAPVAQGIVEATVGREAQDATAIAKVLARDTDAALDRLTLSQYASLPAGGEGRGLEPAQSSRWFAEIPLAFAQGTAVLPLEIEREAPRRDVASAEAAIWRVRFALDGEPVGPLNALVTMQDKAIGVTVWAVRDSTSKLLQQAAPGLRQALTAERFERAEIEIFTGTPAQPKLAAGHFLDRRS